MRRSSWEWSCEGNLQRGLEPAGRFLCLVVVEKAVPRSLLVHRVGSGFSFVDRGIGGRELSVVARNVPPMTVTSLPRSAADCVVEDLAGLSDEEVVDGLLTWAGRVAAGEARLIAFIGELDARDAWGAWGILSCAHWLSWRCGMSLRTGREYVRVARALRLLPLTAAGFAAGRLSYSQVRAITRVAGLDDEGQWVQLARVASGAQLERLARGVTRARMAARDAADVEDAAYRLRTTVGYEDDGTVRISVRLPAADAAVVLAAIDAACEDLHQQEHQQQQQPEQQPGTETAGAAAAGQPRSGEGCGQAGSAEPGRLPRPVLPSGRVASPSRTEGLLAVARRFIDDRAVRRPQTSRRSRTALQVLIDPLSGWARLPDGELLPPPCSAPLLRDMHGWGLRPLTALDLTARDLGRAARQPDRGLRGLLEHIDGKRCRFPGCTHRRNLHAHHVRWWRHGGRTDLNNLILLCARHHTLIHERGYLLRLHPDRSLDVSTFNGQPIPHRPPLPWQDPDELDPDRRIDPTTLAPTVIDGRIDLHRAVFVICQQAA